MRLISHAARAAWRVFGESRGKPGVLDIPDLRQNHAFCAAVEGDLDARLVGLPHPHETGKTEAVAERHQPVEGHLLDRSVLHVEDDCVIAGQAAISQALCMSVSSQKAIRGLGKSLS